MSGRAGGGRPFDQLRNRDALKDRRAVWGRPFDQLSDRGGLRSRAAMLGGHLVALALLLTSLVLVPSALEPEPAGAAEGDQTAVAELGSCMTSQGSGDIVVLIDQSGSLRRTDPDDERVQAARYLVSRLATFASENQVDLSIAIAGFDADYVTRTGWQSVRDGSAGSLLDALDGLRDSDAGLDTDYWTALEGARRSLRDQARGSGGQRCQAIVLFTDGRFDIEPRSDIRKPYAPDVDLSGEDGAREAERRGRESLCRAGGLVDQLRRSEVKLFVVGLQGGGDRSDFSLVRSIAEGGTDPRCGGIQRASMGQFLLARDIGDLIFAFDALSDPNQPPLTQEKPICEGGPCARGTHPVVLDSSIGAVRILAGSDLPGTSIQVRGPTGAPTVLSDQDGTAQLGQVSMRWSWVSAAAAEIRLEPNSPQSEDWKGVWEVTFFRDEVPDGARARTNVHVAGDLVMQLAAGTPTQWRTGGASDVAFAIVRRGTDEVVEPATIESQVAMSAVLQLDDDRAIPILSTATPAEGTRPTPVDLTEVDPGRGKLVMTLDVTTAPATGRNGRRYDGTKLAPQVTEQPIRILPPANYPTVESELVDFGTTETIDPLTASATVAGPGCVWLSRATVETAPEGVDTTVASPANAAQSCFDVAGGATAEVPLQLTASAVGNGTITGELTMRLRSNDAGTEPVDVTVPYVADMRKPADTGRLLGWLIGLLALGVLLPIALLWFMSWWRSRIPGKPLLAISVPVAIEGRSVRRTDTGGGLLVLANDQRLQPVPVPSGGTRLLQLEGVTLRVTMMRNPLDPHVVVEAPAGRTVASGAKPARSGRLARLPLAVHQNWLLMREAGGATSILFLFAGLADQAAIDEVVADARQRAPELLAEIAPREAEPASVGAGSRWDGDDAPRAPGPPGAGPEDPWGHA